MFGIFSAPPLDHPFWWYLDTNTEVPPFWVIPQNKRHGLTILVVPCNKKGMVLPPCLVVPRKKKSLVSPFWWYLDTNTEVPPFWVIRSPNPEHLPLPSRSSRPRPTRTTCTTRPPPPPSRLLRSLPSHASPASRLASPSPRPLRPAIPAAPASPQFPAKLARICTRCALRVGVC